MNIRELKRTIRECMREIKESCSGSSSMHHSQSQMELDDPDLRAGKWNDLVNQCTMSPDPEFRLKVFIPAMTRAPAKVWQGMFEAINEDADLQEEIFKAISDYRNNNRQ
jgi:hypothetical protein